MTKDYQTPFFQITVKKNSYFNICESMSVSFRESMSMSVSVRVVSVHVRSCAWARASVQRKENNLPVVPAEDSGSHPVDCQQSRIKPVYDRCQSEYDRQ